MYYNFECITITMYCNHGRHLGEGEMRNCTTYYVVYVSVLSDTAVDVQSHAASSSWRLGIGTHSFIICSLLKSLLTDGLKIMSSDPMSCWWWIKMLLLQYMHL